MTLDAVKSHRTKTAWYFLTCRRHTLRCFVHYSWKLREMISQDIAKEQKEATVVRDTSSLSHGRRRGRNQVHTPCFDRSRYRARCDLRFAFDDHMKKH